MGIESRRRGHGHPSPGQENQKKMNETKFQNTMQFVELDMKKKPRKHTDPNDWLAGQERHYRLTSSYAIISFHSGYIVYNNLDENCFVRLLSSSKCNEAIRFHIRSTMRLHASHQTSTLFLVANEDGQKQTPDVVYTTATASRNYKEESVCARKCSFRLDCSVIFRLFLSFLFLFPL
jgi:hypothetical protein